MPTQVGIHALPSDIQIAQFSLLNEDVNAGLRRHDSVTINGQPKGPLVVRRETGKEQEVAVLYDEDVARHIAPEPCVVSREGQGEASAGAHAGWPLSRERALSRTPTGLPTWQATRPVALSRATGWSGVVRDPSMCGHSLSGNREISSPAGAVARRRSARGRGQTRSPR